MSGLTHQRARELLQAGLSRDLLSFEQAALEHHLRNCADCRQFGTEMERFEMQLSDALQTRWPEPIQRAAKVDSLVETIHRKSARRLPFERLAGALASLSWIVAGAGLMTALFWALNTFTEDAASTSVPEPGASTPEPVEQTFTLSESFYAQIEMNCDYLPEQVYVLVNEGSATQAVPLNLLDYRAGDQIVGVQLRDGSSPRERILWEFRAKSVGGDTLWEPVIIRTAGCDKLLGLITDGRARRTVIAHWDGVHMETVLNAPGWPVNTETDPATHFLTDWQTITISSTENVNAAKCNAVSTIYWWDGEQFVRLSEFAVAGTSCTSGG